MYDLAGENGLDLEALRARLRRMSERELLRFGRAARHMCSPAANLGKAPRQMFVIQLREVAKEWGRRHPLWMNPQKIDPLNMRHISTRQKQ